MYSGFYKFEVDPFAINPGDDFIFESFDWRKARNKIYDALVNSGGAWVIAGPSGMGKTTFCRRMWNNLSLTHRCVFIRNTFIEAPNLMQNINKFFDISPQGGGVDNQLKLLENHLKLCAEKGEKTILILDEAQNVEADLLESLLRISFQGSKYSFFIVLSGRYNLYDRFASGEETFLPEMKIDLGCFSEDEVAKYIKLCLRQAGNTQVVFTDAAIKEIHTLTEGKPFLVSAACRQSLEISARLKSFSITEAVAAKAVKKVEKDLLPETLTPMKTHFFYLLFISIIFFIFSFVVFELAVTNKRVVKEQKAHNKVEPDIVSMMITKKQSQELNKKAEPDFSLLTKKEYIASQKLYVALEVLIAWNYRRSLLESTWLLYQKEKNINLSKVATACGFEAVSFFADINFVRRSCTPLILKLMKGKDFEYCLLREVSAEGVLLKSLDDEKIIYSWEKLKDVWMGDTVIFARQYPFDGENIFVGSHADVAVVKYVQDMLVAEKLLDAKDANGVFGKATHEAVKKFQSAHGFVSDGVINKVQQVYIYMYMHKNIPLIENKIYKIGK